MPDKETFALINALLNASAGVLIVVGYVLIKQRKYVAHGWVMGSAIVIGIAFLACYVFSKLIHGEQSSGIPAGWYRFVYLYIVLFPHLTLAIALVPMICITVWRAWKRDWTRHRRIAPWTLAVWLYVSITGVLIYFMLYKWYPAMYPEAWENSRSLF